MTNLVIFLFAVMSLLMLAWGLLHKNRIVQFPFLVGAVATGWMLPQLIGLLSNPYLPPGGLIKTSIMAVLCLGGAWWGYSVNRRPATFFWWQLDRQRLIWCSALLSVLGAGFYFLVSLKAPEIGSQWTGVVTIYVFFSKLMAVGMAIALVLGLSRPSWPTTMIIIFDLLIYVDLIVLKGRRESMIELALMIGLAMWFQRRWLPSRMIIVVVVVLGSVLINSIGDYRNTMLGEDRWSWSGAGPAELLELDYAENFRAILGGEANSEMTNAVYNIEIVDRTMRLDFGLSLWNSFIKRYVPAQLVGQELKEQLLVEGVRLRSGVRRGDMEIHYEPKFGTTATGLSDAFESFWYFGFIKFVLIGFIISRWYRAAIMGNITAQFIVMLVITPGLHAFTHTTNWFFIFFLQLAVFLLPVVVFARVIKPDHSSDDALASRGIVAP